MNKAKLNTIEHNALSRIEMTGIRGGNMCGCACKYAEEGGSSNDANGWANNAAGTYSEGVPLESQDYYCDDLEETIIKP